MKEITLTAPKSIEDLRIKHFDALTNVKFKGDITMSLIAQFVASITGEDIMLVHRVDSTQLIEVFNHCIELFANFDKDAKPPKQITIEGQNFSLVDPHKVASGWHIDLASSGNLNDKPLRLAALMYIPTDHVYGELDDNNNIVFPLREREELFKEHFKLQDFVSASAFFLKKLKQ